MKVLGGQLWDEMGNVLHIYVMQICDVVSLVGLRKTEKKELQRVSYVQNINSSITSIIPTTATVFTFVVHTLLGLSLNTSDVSTTAVQHTQYNNHCQHAHCVY